MTVMETVSGCTKENNFDKLSFVAIRSFDR